MSKKTCWAHQGRVHFVRFLSPHLFVPFFCFSSPPDHHCRHHVHENFILLVFVFLLVRRRRYHLLLLCQFILFSSSFFSFFLSFPFFFFFFVTQWRFFVPVPYWKVLPTRRDRQMAEQVRFVRGYAAAQVALWRDHIAAGRLHEHDTFGAILPELVHQVDQARAAVRIFYYYLFVYFFNNKK